MSIGYSAGAPTSFYGVPLDISASADALSPGVESMSRLNLSASVVNASGTARATLFTAPRTVAVNNISVPTGGGAQAGPTLCRAGIASVDASGNLTMLAVTANDTTMWNATFTDYPRALGNAVILAAGTRYALIALQVATTAAGFIGSTLLSTVQAAVFGLPPVLTSAVPALADLPVVGGQILVGAQQVGNSALFWGRVF